MYKIDKIPFGVLYGDQVLELFEICKLHNFALPAINCISSSSLNAAMEAAKKANSPIIIQLSTGGSQFYAGKGSELDKQEAAIMGAVAAAYHVHTLAEKYEIRVILHSDHCHPENIQWFDGMLQYDSKFHKHYQRPLFSSHMLDLSTTPIKENINISTHYLEKMKDLSMILEIELGITGGEEDGVDQSHRDSSELYTKPEDVDYAYTQLSAISPLFTIAASFGNVHGVYHPGNVHLEPDILAQAQEYVRNKHQLSQKKPINLVFHGGSGSQLDKIHQALQYGVVKFNIDTDTQWAYWDGVHQYYQQNSQYLQGQLGNPEGADQPNKKKYDPRVWLRQGEVSMVDRIIQAYHHLNSFNANRF